MKYTLHTSFNWYTTDESRQVVKLFLINGVPFTFDELEERHQDDPLIINQATQNREYEPETLYRASMYLISEECHPMLYELELENPEILTEADI
tara:strand:+ start:1779 stop:2060 length:282 start_codon:yes stop_codon:yes gene_type:complete